MSYESHRDPSLVTTLKTVFADLKDLVQKEIRLAKAELGTMVADGLKAGIWMAAAGLLGFVAVLLLIQAAVFGLASLGLGPGWASLIVAVALLVAAAGAFFYGRSLAGSMKPNRTTRQINQDITAVREQLT